MGILLIIGCILLIYSFLIVLGKHTISFLKPLIIIGVMMALISLLDILGIVVIPNLLKYLMVLIVCHAVVCIVCLWLYAKGRKLERPDIIFVFGAGLIENRLSLSLKTRLDKAIELHHMYPQCPIIVSGGQGRNEWLSEAEAMKDYLLSKHINEEVILVEDTSTTTQENLVFAMRLYPLRNKKIALVSNQFHVYRTEKMATKLGLNGFAVPAYMHHIGTFAFYIREYFACIKAFIKQEI